MKKEETEVLGNYAVAHSYPCIGPQLCLQTVGSRYQPSTNILLEGNLSLLGFSFASKNARLELMYISPRNSNFATKTQHPI